MSRFYVPKDSIRGNKAVISGKEAHHIMDVMRLKKLDKIVAFDGTGHEYIGFIKDTFRDSLSIEIVETRRPSGKSSSSVTLIQSIPKKEKMDYIVEKATELGASRIIPVVTARTVPRWDQAKRAVNAERWRKIAKGASKQCGRADIPAVDEIKDFNECLKDSSDYDIALVAALSDDAVKIKDALSGFKGGKIAVAIGPEGDFTADEVNAAREAGFKLINLGQRVLKSDTAGVFVLAILNYEFSN